MTQPAIPPIKFAQARGARLAWQEFGDGPTIVAIPPTAQNIEVAWEWPRVRTMFERLGSFCHWVHFDKRGSGASDRRSHQPGLDERVEDLRAVLDSAGIERATLYGASEGGPTCLMFAVTYPHRVEGLILHGTGPYTTNPHMTDAEYDDYVANIERFVEIWGTPDSPMVDGFAPSIADEPGYREWHQRYERLAATRDSLYEMLEIHTSVDVSDIIEDIDVPTLILHSKRDRVVPVEYGRLLLAGIENAQMVEYDIADHFGYADLAWIDDIERFLTGSVQHRAEPPVAAPAPASVSIQVLGQFRVLRDGVPVPNSAWGSRQARQLCKRLVLARGWPVRRDELFEQLWPDEPEVRKLGPRLSVLLSSLRRNLEGAVHADRSTITLDLAHLDVDLERLLEAEDDLTTVELFAGDVLPGDPDEPWAAGVRDQARARFTAAAYRLLDDVEHATAADKRASLEGIARQLIALDRWDDRAHRALIRLLLVDERDGDARRAHQAWATAMDELDIEVEELASFA